MIGSFRWIGLLVFSLLASGFQCGVNGDGLVEITCEDGDGSQEPCVQVDDGSTKSTRPMTTTGSTGTTVIIEPAEIELERRETTNLTAQVTLGTEVADAGIVCTATGGIAVVNGSQCTYTAPPDAGVYYVIATSTGDPTAWGVAKVVVRQVTLRLTPKLILLGVGKSFKFDATIEGSENEAVAWSIVEGAGPTYGTISADGTYRAPEAAEEVTVHVRATSAADPMVQRIAEIQISENPELTITVHPSTTTLESGDSLEFHATVAEETDDNVLWTIERIGVDDDLGEAVLAGNFLLAGPRPSHFRVRATSKSNPAMSATSDVRVVEPEGFTLRGLVAPVDNPDPTKNILISPLLHGVGATYRKGPGVYRLHAGQGELDEPEGLEEVPPLFVAWEDSGMGVFRPTLDRWGLLTMHGEGDPEAFYNITLEAPRSPTDDIPQAAKPSLMARASEVFVTFESILADDWFQDEWPYPAFDEGQLLAEAVDDYEVQLALATDITFATPTSVIVPVGSAPAALFTGLVVDTQYHVRIRGRQSQTSGAWSDIAAITTTSVLPAGTTLTTSLDTTGVPHLTSSRVLFFVDGPSEDGSSFAVLYGPDLSAQVEVPGLNAGVHRVTALFDQNGDGVFGPTERTVIAPQVVLATGSGSTAQTGIPVQATGPAVLVQRMQRYEDEELEELEVHVFATDAPLMRASIVRRPAAVADQLTVPLDLSISPDRPFFRGYGFHFPKNRLRENSEFIINATTPNGWTKSASVKLARLPQPMRNLIATYSGSEEPMLVEWDPPTQTGIFGYHLELFKNGDMVDSIAFKPYVAMAPTEWSIEGLVPGDDYWVKSMSFDALGNSTVVYAGFHFKEPVEPIPPEE